MKRNNFSAFVFIILLAVISTQTAICLHSNNPIVNDQGHADKENQDGAESTFTCGVSTVTDIDGHIYNTLLIGDQCWLKENLRVTRNPAGSSITRYCYADDDDNCLIYGGLYNWNVMMNGASSSSGNPSGVQGICPTGWHIPSDDEWLQLSDYIGGATLGGNRLKSCRQVNSPLGAACDTGVHPRWDENAAHWGTDNYGFSALPAGYRYGAGVYDKYGKTLYLWSSTERSTNTSDAYYRDIYHTASNIYRSWGSKSYNFSVRCVKDAGIEQTIDLENITIPDGTEQCYNALQTITVSNFVVENGGQVLLIAGESIHLLAGTLVQAGGYLKAHITETNEYCEPATKRNEPTPGMMSMTSIPEAISEPGFFTIYPNPSSGIFTIELDSFSGDEPIFAEVHSIAGGRVFIMELPAQGRHTFSLSDQQPGLFIIWVTQGQRVGIGKLIIKT